MVGDVATGAVAKAAGHAQAGPAGRLVAGSREACGVDEGFDGMERMAMNPLPVGGQPFDREGQDLGGQVPDPPGRKNEVADVVGKIVQTTIGQIVRPSDEAIPEGTAESGGAPPQKSYPLPLEKCYMTEGLADHPSEGEIVMLPHELVPSGLLDGMDRPDLKSRQIAQGQGGRGVGRRHPDCYIKLKKKSPAPPEADFEMTLSTRRDICNPIACDINFPRFSSSLLS